MYTSKFALVLALVIVALVSFGVMPNDSEAATFPGVSSFTVTVTAGDTSSSVGLTVDYEFDKVAVLIPAITTTDTITVQLTTEAGVVIAAKSIVIATAVTTNMRSISLTEFEGWLLAGTFKLRVVLPATEGSDRAFVFYVSHD